MQLFTSHDLATALRSAAEAHHEYEAKLGKRDENWAEWYAEFIVRNTNGTNKLTPETLRERADELEARAREQSPRSTPERDRARFLLAEAGMLRGIASELEDV